SGATACYLRSSYSGMRGPRVQTPQTRTAAARSPRARSRDRRWARAVDAAPARHARAVRYDGDRTGISRAGPFVRHSSHTGSPVLTTAGGSHAASAQGTSPHVPSALAADPDLDDPDPRGHVRRDVPGGYVRR